MSFSLKASPIFSAIEGPVVLAVMDGVGIGPKDAGDAVHVARTPTLDWLAANAPFLQLRAHGTAVGLPSDDDMGNSEVGHNAIGAGRVFDQGAKRVVSAIESGEIFRTETWIALTRRVRESAEPMHFIGLLSDGNVHSHIEHLFALIRQCDAENIARVRVHVLLDGRDVPETSALTYIDALETRLADYRTKGRDYRIASGGGRMKVTMDRYGADWDMVQRGWRTHVRGDGRFFADARQAITALREEQPGVGDQNLPAFVIADSHGKPVGPIRDGASVVFFNFRGDRAIELSRAFDDEAFPYFDRGARPSVLYAGMMQYDGDLMIPRHFLVNPPAIDRTLGEYLAANGVSQYAISETQKYGHVTYFWNGNRGGMFDASRETYVEIKSDSRPFEERPWMKAAEITDALVDALFTGKYRHARLNYANGDMVGHTGVFQSAVIAVEAVDLQLARLLPVIERLKGALLITADHGNADEMFEMDKKTKVAALSAEGKPKPKTSHTLNPVPLYLYAPSAALKFRQAVEKPGLSNLASTVLELLGYEPPSEYDASLLAR